MRVLAFVLVVAGALVTFRGVTLDPLQWRWVAIWALVVVGVLLMGAGYLLATAAAARAERRRVEAQRRRRPGYIERRP